jgi:NTE family protein
MSERALVLGGGGASGNAWVIGVVAGLFDLELDVTGADLIVGTSAGATAAAQLSSATRPPELLANILAEAPPPASRPAASEGGRVPTRPAANLLEITGAIISAAKDAAEMRRKVGAALDWTGMSDDSRHTQWRATVAARLPSRHWPDRPLLVTAVDARTGEPVVFDRHSGVDLVDAVAASCAGGFAYRIDDRRYIDGGYRANENADLAAGYARVLVLSPLSGRSRHRSEWGTHLSAQADVLRARGSRVEIVIPDTSFASALGMGMNIMDLSRRGPSAQAGYEQGRALAERLTGFWR